MFVHDFFESRFGVVQVSVRQRYVDVVEDFFQERLDRASAVRLAAIVQDEFDAADERFEHVFEQFFQAMIFVLV